MRLWVGIFWGVLLVAAIAYIVMISVTPWSFGGNAHYLIR
jgi:hypothetical protein